MRFEAHLGKLPRFRGQSPVVASGQPEAGSELARRSRLAPVMSLLIPNGFEWPATRPRTLALAPEGSPDQPGHPIDEHWREPNGEHHQPRLRPLKAGHRPGPLLRDPGILHF